MCSRSRVARPDVRKGVADRYGALDSLYCIRHALPVGQGVPPEVCDPMRTSIMSDDEIFDVCDANDNVIGQAARSEVHAQGLLHRAVHMWVFRSDGRLLLHYRSATKDEYPHCYTSSASGHVDAGESYDAAAVREMREELDLEAPLTRLVRLPAGPETANEHTVLYQCETDKPVTPDPGEIERIEWRTLDEIAAIVDATPEMFTPPFRSLFAWYREQRG